MISDSPVCLETRSTVWLHTDQWVHSFFPLWRWQPAGAAYWQSHDCLWTNGCVTESKTLGKGEAMDVIQNKNLVAFYCQAMRLYLRASSLTISVLLTFNILTFIRGNGKWTSAVHRRDEAGGGWMQWDLLPSSPDKVNIDTPTAQHNTREYTPRNLSKWLQTLSLCLLSELQRPRGPHKEAS